MKNPASIHLPATHLPATPLPASKAPTSQTDQEKEDRRQHALDRLRARNRALPQEPPPQEAHPLSKKN